MPGHVACAAALASAFERFPQIRRLPSGGSVEGYTGEVIALLDAGTPAAARELRGADATSCNQTRPGVPRRPPRAVETSARLAASSTVSHPHQSPLRV